MNRKVLRDKILENTYRKVNNGLINKLIKEMLDNAYVVVVAMTHTDIDYNFIQQNFKAVFDKKDAMKNIAIRDNVELL